MEITITRPSLVSTRAYREPTTLTAATDITVTHNLGVPPVVFFVPTTEGAYSMMLNVKHAADFMSFTYTFAEAVTGKLYVL